MGLVAAVVSLATVPISSTTMRCGGAATTKLAANMRYPVRRFMHNPSRTRPAIAALFLSRSSAGARRFPGLGGSSIRRLRGGEVPAGSAPGEREGGEKQDEDTEKTPAGEQDEPEYEEEEVDGDEEEDYDEEDYEETHTYADVEFINPTNSSKRVMVRGLVDTGGTDCDLRAALVRKLDLPVFDEEEEYETAAGTLKTKSYRALISCMGKEAEVLLCAVPDEAYEGDDPECEDDAIIGHDAIADLDLLIDCKNACLMQRPS